MLSINPWRLTAEYRTAMVQAIERANPAFFKNKKNKKKKKSKKKKEEVPQVYVAASDQRQR